MSMKKIISTIIVAVVSTVLFTSNVAAVTVGKTLTGTRAVTPTTAATNSGSIFLSPVFWIVAILIVIAVIAVVVGLAWKKEEVSNS